MEKLFITGLTGRSGSYLLKEMIKEPLKQYEIKAVYRNCSKIKYNNERDLKIEWVEGDLTNKESMVAAMGEVDTVLHIAGIGWSLNVVEAAIECGVKRLILVHTTGIYSKYKAAGALYIEIEEKIREMIAGKGISLTILRPTMIYGSLDDMNIIRFIKWVDGNRVFPVVKKGTFALQPVHHKDLGKAYYQVLNSTESTDNRDFVLSGGTVIDLIDILKTACQYLDKKTTFVSVPFWFAYTGAVGLYLLSLKKIDYREKVQRLVEPRAYSHQEATDAFGYAPISFYDGLREEVDLYLKSKNEG